MLGFNLNCKSEELSIISTELSPTKSAPPRNTLLPATTSNSPAVIVKSPVFIVILPSFPSISVPVIVFPFITKLSETPIPPFNTNVLKAALEEPPLIVYGLLKVIELLVIEKLAPEVFGIEKVLHLKLSKEIIPVCAKTFISSQSIIPLAPFNSIEISPPPSNISILPPL